MTDREAQSLRARCLEWALQTGGTTQEVLANAKAYEAYIKGEPAAPTDKIRTYWETRADEEAESSRMDPDVLDPPANETEDEAVEAVYAEQPETLAGVAAMYSGEGFSPFTFSDTSIHTEPNGQEPTSTEQDAEVSEPNSGTGQG